MEVFRILILHLAVFAVAGAVVSVSRLAARVTRAIRLAGECSQLKTPKPRRPVFAGERPALLRRGQGAAGSFSNGANEASEWPGQISV